MLKPLPDAPRDHDANASDLVVVTGKGRYLYTNEVPRRRHHRAQLHTLRARRARHCLALRQRCTSGRMLASLVRAECQA